jgi:hypothetical protein
MDTVSREDVEHLLKSFFDHPERQTFKDREVIKMLVNRAHKASYQGITRQTIPFEIGCTAYRYVLDSGGSAEEALKYSAKIHDKSVEWLEGVKNNPYYHSSRVVKGHNDHPQQKLMLYNGTMDKSALKSSETVNKQIRKLSKARKLSDTLEGLKLSDRIQQEEIDILKAESVGMKYDIQFLNKVAGLEGEPKKDRAVRMRGLGCTQKAIAESLGVNVRTINRWLK